MDAVRLRAASAGVPIRPRQEWPSDPGNNVEEAEAPDQEDNIGTKAVGYSQTKTLFIRVTQGKQGVLQIHQAHKQEWLSSMLRDFLFFVPSLSACQISDGSNLNGYKHLCRIEEVWGALHRASHFHNWHSKLYLVSISN